MTTLPPAFLGPPLAHRALHDREAGRPENSRAAIRAAIDHGYGIETDVQLSADGVAMVIHDSALKRLTGVKGSVQATAAAALGQIPLLGGSEGIPTLAEVLALVAGRAALLIEIKDQDGALGPKVGPLERAVAADLAGYEGPVAVMGFNPHSIAVMAEAAPDVARGLTTAAFALAGYPRVPAATRKRLRAIPDYQRVGASFISHDARDLSRPRVAEIKAAGGHVLCWTIRSPAEETKAREVAENVTFERYLAALPA